MRYFTISLLFLFLLCSCSDNVIDDNNPSPVVDPVDDKAEGTQEDLSNAIQNFGYDVFLNLAKKADDQEAVIISPLSISGALYMALNGAKEETYNEMELTLDLDGLNLTGTNEAYFEFLENITRDNSPESSLQVAHSVFWSPINFNIDDQFEDRMQDFYSAEVSNDKFTVNDINSWASEKTEGRIPQVLKEIRNDEIMFLLNALYFLGDWESPFDINLTNERPFTLSDGDQVDAPTMQLDYPLNYNITDEYNAVDLYFKDRKYAMTFIEFSDDLNDAVGSFDSGASFATYYDSILSNMSEERVLLSLPKFELEYAEELKETLSDLGMPRAFSDTNAQFSGFGTAGGNIYLSRVLHDTFLKIDEKGAEGAAVTTVGVGVESVPPSIAFDNPFLFVLRHVESGIPIFVGTVANPLD